jgi:CheY-like chemotaxis protein
MALLADTLPKNIRLEARVAPGLWTLQADPTQLHQVLLNLAVNARDAMPDGGRLLIVAENVVLDEQRAATDIEARVGPYVRIEVRDTGAGIPREIQDKIFDPFFTTKPVGKGTGLGLSTSLNIVRGHRGFIRAHCDPGAGARFVVHLPAAPLLAAPGAEQDVAAGPPRGRGELVLVVDDERLVSEVTRRVLEKAGYRVLVAVDGSEAVALYRRHGRDIAVVLTDMRMPVLDGPGTIRELRRLDPLVRVIGSSGLSGEDEVAEVASAGVRHFLAKPYAADALLWTVRRALEE